MFRAAAWLTKASHSQPRLSSSSQSLSALDEPQDLDRALRAMSLVMDDDIAGAEAFFDQGNSTFHKVGNGVIAFIRATLGFEAEVIREASEIIGNAEAAAENERRNAVKKNRTISSYPPGAEYALCNAQAQLMAAVIGILSESVVEAMKAFYKLRTAYKVLESLHTNVESVMSKRDAAAASADSKTIPDESDSDDDEFFEVEAEKPASGTDSPRAPPRLQRRHTYESSDIIDDFVESGTSLCFGILMLFISLIPPALTRLLSILGFRGDRERGLKTLWAATKFENVHGSLATLIILNYYSGITQFCDIVEEDEAKGGYPKKRCEAALKSAQRRHPNSLIWIIEESRMTASSEGLDKSVNMLQIEKKPQMRQIEALMIFERAIQSLFRHDHQQVANSFEQLIELNSWSHALYHYIAGISLLELYRQNLATDPARAKGYAEQGEAMILKAPASLGKKRFMAKSLPLEVFVERKIRKWEAYAKERDVRLFDAIGVSPAEEMIYLWNGYKKMNNAMLTDSLSALEWRPARPRPVSRKSTASASHSMKSAKSQMSTKAGVQNTGEVDDLIDEKVVHNLLRSVVLRHLGDIATAKKILEENVLPVDRNLLKGQNREDWAAPAAHYEMAVCLWQESGPKEAAATKEWLSKAANWESYELDTRIGLRVVTALDALKNY